MFAFAPGGSKLRSCRRQAVASKTPPDCSDHPTDGFAFLRKSHGGCDRTSNKGGRIRLHFHSRKGMKIEVSPGPCPASKAPPEPYIRIFESVSKTEKDQSERIGLFLAGLIEMNRRSRNEANNHRKSFALHRK